MKTTKKILAVLTAVIMIAGVFSGCGGNTANNSSSSSNSISSQGGAAPAEIATGMVDSVTVAVDDDSFSLAPWASDSGLRTWVEYALWGRLAFRPYIGAPLEEMELALAKNITKVDDYTYDIELYDYIYDSQGNHITASDVVFSYDKAKELGYNSFISLYYQSSEVLDEYVVELHLTDKTVEGSIELVLDTEQICSQSWFENASAEDLVSNPASTGAYAVKSVQAGASVTIEARDYWKTDESLITTIEKQNAKEIVIKCIPEASMRSIALENQEVDMAEINSAEVVAYQGNSAYNITQYPNPMNEYLVFNTSDASVCKDVKVRQAVAYAFDAATMFLGNGHDQGTMLHDVCPNITPDYQAEWDTEPYYDMDIDKAKELLAEAGYGEGELTIRLMVTTQAPQGPYQAFQSMLQTAGIDCQIVSYDRTLYASYLYDETQWDITTDTGSVQDFTASYWSKLFSDKTYEKGTKGFTVDAHLQELLIAANEDHSAENMNAFHDYYTEQCYMLGLYNETKTILTQSGITDVCLTNGEPILQAMTFTSDYQSVD